MEGSQRGWSSFGMLVILAVAVAAGYYAYKGISGADEAPGCKSAFNYCMKSCRRTVHDCLDGAVAAVPHPAGDAEPLGLFTHRVAEADALDAPGDFQMLGHKVIFQSRTIRVK